jgi:hypothetical protein
MSDPQPVPFEIVEHENGLRVASNGQVRLSLTEVDGKLFRRRGISGLALKPAAEMLLPLVNELAGDLLNNPSMLAEEAVGRLLAMAGQVPVKQPQRHEWAVVELDNVKVFTNGLEIIVTRQDLRPC